MGDLTKALTYYGLNIEENLEHIGILGMKWGKRKAVGPDSDDHAKIQGIQKKSVNSMSNAELKAYNERKQLETTYRTLNPSKVERARKLVTQLLGDAEKIGKVYTALGSPGKAALMKKLGIKVPDVAKTKGKAENVEAAAKKIFDKAMSVAGAAPISSFSTSKSTTYKEVVLNKPLKMNRW